MRLTSICAEESRRAQSGDLRSNRREDFTNLNVHIMAAPKSPRAPNHISSCLGHNCHHLSNGWSLCSNCSQDLDEIFLNVLCSAELTWKLYVPAEPVAFPYMAGTTLCRCLRTPAIPPKAQEGLLFWNMAPHCEMWAVGTALPKFKSQVCHSQ